MEMSSEIKKIAKYGFIMLGLLSFLLAGVFYISYLDAKADLEPTGLTYDAQEWQSLLEWRDSRAADAELYNSLTYIFIALGIVGVLIGCILFVMDRPKPYIEMQESTFPPTPYNTGQSEIFCPYCGNNNPSEYNYCNHCKKPLLKSQNVNNPSRPLEAPVERPVPFPPPPPMENVNRPVVEERFEDQYQEDGMTKRIKLVCTNCGAENITRQDVCPNCRTILYKFIRK